MSKENINTSPTLKVFPIFKILALLVKSCLFGFLKKFIEQFVQNIPWAHLDIAGVTWSKSNSDLYPKGGTAFGVRLLNSYVKNYIE